MHDPDDIEDDVLEALAAEVLAEATPARRQLAESALSLHDIDSELAQLVADSRSSDVVMRNDPSAQTFQVVLAAGPTQVILDVEQAGGDAVEVVVLVTDGPLPTSGRLLSADGSPIKSASKSWPLVFGPIRSTSTVRLEIVGADATTYRSPWIGL